MKLFSRIRKMKQSDDIQVSALEKIIINFATPFEFPAGLAIKLWDKAVGNTKDNAFIDYGVWRFL